MDAVTTKPVTLTRLQAAIAEGIGFAERHAVAVGSETTTPRLRELIDMLGEEAVAEIVGTFAEDVQANLETMRLSAAEGSVQTLGRIAHSVAGAARNVGADALAVRASVLEAGIGALSTSQIAAEITALQADLEAALDRLGIKAAARAST